jgi:hypothetical protein
MKNLIQAAVVTLFAASTAQAQQAVQWKVSDGGNGHWYRDLGTSGTVAAIPALLTEIARDAGGHLVSYHSAAEEQFVIQSVGAGMVGLFGVAGSAAFVWSSGEPVTYSNWGCCGCNNAPYPNNSNQSDRIVFQANYPGCTGTQGFGPPWDDYVLSNWGSGIERNFVVIEWSADCNGDGIVDYGQCRDGTLPDYNGNNIPDCCERGEACVVGNYPVQWRVEDGGNGHWYLRILFAGTAGCSTCPPYMCQATAADYAQQRGAFLVSIGSLAEGAFAGNVTNCQSLWTGLTLSAGDGCNIFSWSWSDGTEVRPEVMASGSGGNWCTTWEFACDIRGGQCAPWGLENLSSCWPDVTGLMLEWSADCNRDGIVDYGQILQGQLSDLNTDGVPDICQQPTCVDADIFRDFNVNGADLGILLSQWGPNTPLTKSDLNRDGVVDGVDLGILLSYWGTCE